MEDNDPQLVALRQLIDSLDTELLQILAKRMANAKQVGEFKHSHGLPVYDQKRWQAVLHTRLAQAEALGLSKEFVAALFEIIHAHALEIEAESKPS